MTTLELKRIGTDDWNRPVYKDNNGKLWKDVNLGFFPISLHSAYRNEFDGEPDLPLILPYVII